MMKRRIAMKILFFLVVLTLFSPCQCVHNRIVYIYPGCWGDIFAVDSPLYNRDGCLEPMMKFKNAAQERGYDIRQTYTLEGLEDYKYLLVFEVNEHLAIQLKKLPKKKMILFLWEPPSVIPQNYVQENHRFFSKVYTWHDGLVDNKKYFKLHYPVLHQPIEATVPFHEKKLCTMITSNGRSAHPNQLYKERLKLIDFFESRKLDQDFDFYGRGWPAEQYSTFRGPVEKKVDVLKHYRFTFAYENIEGEPGYVTEKIFDCFHACTVPVYWGAPNISAYVPKNCYISRQDFGSNEELYEFLKAMDEEEYGVYLSNAKKFLSGKTANQFGWEHFVKTMMTLIGK